MGHFLKNVGRPLRSLARRWKAMGNMFRLSQQYPPPQSGVIAGLAMLDNELQLVSVYWHIGPAQTQHTRTSPAFSLIVSKVMCETNLAGGRALVVGNGHASVIADYFQFSAEKGPPLDEIFRAALNARWRQVRECNHPRVTAISFWSDKYGPTVLMAVLKKDGKGQCARRRYEFMDETMDGNLITGYGYCAAVSAGTVRGDPFLVPLRGNASSIAETMQTVLDRHDGSRVGIVVKMLSQDGSTEMAILD